jgi:hypothetical protein
MLMYIVDFPTMLIGTDTRDTCLEQRDKGDLSRRESAEEAPRPPA